MGYIEHLERAKLREGLKAALAVSTLGNVFLTAQEPWKRLVVDPEGAAAHLTAAVGVERPHELVAPGHVLGPRSQPLFGEISTAQVEALRARFAGARATEKGNGSKVDDGTTTKAIG